MSEPRTQVERAKASDANAHLIDVYIDGEKRLDIIWADSISGEYEYHVRGEDGKFIIDGEELRIEHAHSDDIKLLLRTK